MVLFEIGAVKNPRTFLPTGLFNIRSFEPVNYYLIDQGYEQVISMTQEGEITHFSVTRESDQNGVSNSYTFSLVSAVPILQSEILILTFPPDFHLSNSECQNPSTPISCTVIGQTLKSVALDPLSTLTFTLTNVRNPISLKPSEPFTDVRFSTPAGYPISKLYAPSAVLTNTAANTFISPKLTQYDYDALIETTYELEFKPSSHLPRTASLLIKYPDSIVLGS